MKCALNPASRNWNNYGLPVRTHAAGHSQAESAQSRIYDVFRDRHASKKPGIFSI